MTGLLGLTFQHLLVFALLVGSGRSLWAERSITDGWHWKFYIHDGLHIGYQRKRHITGDILLSASLLFGGLRLPL